MKSYLSSLLEFPAFHGGVFHFGPEVVESLFRNEDTQVPLKELTAEVTETFNHFVQQGRFPDQLALRFGERSLLIQAEPLHDTPDGKRATDARFLDNLFLTLSVNAGESIAPLLRQGREVLKAAVKEASAA